MADIEITEAAIEQLREHASRAPAGESAVRVFIDHRCHCGGYKFGMRLDHAYDSDERLQIGGLEVLVARRVADAPGTARIDFTGSALQRWMTVTNSEHACEQRASSDR